MTTNGHAHPSDDRDYSDPEVVKAAIIALREADAELAGSVGHLAAGIAEILRAQKEQLTLSRLTALHVDGLGDARRADRKITEQQIRRLNEQVAELHARKGFVDPEEIRARAKLESNVEHLERTTSKLEEEIEDTRKRNISALVAEAQRVNEERERLQAEARASQHEVVLEKRARWGAREAWALGIVGTIVTVLVTSIAASQCGHAAPPAAKQQTQEPSK